MMRNGSGLFGALLILSLFDSSVGAQQKLAEQTGFAVAIVLTEAATQTLKAKSEGMVMYVAYYGWPEKGAEEHGDEVGRINFDPDRTIGVSGKSGTYHVPEASLDPQRLAWIDGPVYVNVNVASARLRGPDNLLHCESIDAPLADVVRAAATLRCGLIDGDPDDPLNR